MILKIPLFLNLLSYVLTKVTVAPTHLLIIRAGPCKRNQKSVVSVSELSITRQKNDVVVRGRFNISKDIEDGWAVKGLMQKCKDIRNVDTCDYYKSFTVVRDGCREVDDSGENVYEMFLHYSRPILRCPIKAGSYSIAGYPYYTEDNYFIVPEAKLSTSMFGYMLRLEGFNEEEKLMCVDIYLRLLYIRKHDWLKKGKFNSTDGTAETTVSDEQAEEQQNFKLLK